jgi:hypothetical protein
MSIGENKALVLRYFDEIDRTGDESVLDQYVCAPTSSTTVLRQAVRLTWQA